MRWRTAGPRVPPRLTGDQATARALYDQFFALWSGADESPADGRKPGRIRPPPVVHSGPQCQRHLSGRRTCFSRLSSSRSTRATPSGRGLRRDAALRLEVESLLQFHDAANAAEIPTQPRRTIRSSFAPGEVFAGRYRMVERIGRGGMGDVWRADDLVLETEVALKVIQSARPAARERIFTEVRLARQITHPAVCRVFDVGEAAGRDLLLDGAHPRRGSRGAAAARRPAAAGEGRRHRAAAVRGSCRGARARCASSRSEAGERADRRRRASCASAISALRFREPRPTAIRSRARPPTWRRSSGRRAWRSRSEPTSTRSGSCCTTCCLDAHIRHQAKRDAPPPRSLDPGAERRSAARAGHHGGARPGSERSACVGARDGGHAVPVVGTQDQPGVQRRSQTSPPLEELSVGGRAGARRRHRRSRHRRVLPRLAERRHAERAGHHRAGRFRERHRRAGVRRHAEGRAGRRARAVAVSQGVSRRARARNAAPDGALAGRADHAIGRARNRAARAAQGAARRLDRAARRRTTCSPSKRSTRRPAT